MMTRVFNHVEQSGHGARARERRRTSKAASGRSLMLAILCTFLVVAAGCKQSPKPADQASDSSGAAVQPASAASADQQLTQAVQARLAGEPALKGTEIDVSAANAVVTLSGSVPNEASRALAGTETGSVDGVKTVVNNLTITPERGDKSSHREPVRKPARTAPVVAAAPPPPSRLTEAVNTIPAPPPVPPAPVEKTVTLPAGTVIPIRMTDTLDSATTQSDTAFQASVATDLVADGMVAIRRGSSVTGRVITAKNAAHFSGNSELSIELTTIRTPNQVLSVVTDPYTKKGAGRGKNTAMKTGGGAALGAIIGGLAGGGKGAAIGAVTGGGVGAGVNTITRGQQVKIDSESLVNFRLVSPVTVTTSVKAGGTRSSYSGSTPQLQ